MNRTRHEWARWLLVCVFAAAMAWVESAVVYYLRTLVGRVEPYQADPLPIVGGLGRVELVREAATLVMLAAVGILAGRTWRSRLGYAAVAFGVWDILYYVFLKEMCAWPKSVLDWDILFLLPLPWWGPVLAPVAIATLLLAWGTMTSQFDAGLLERRESRGAWLLNWCGVLLALYVFMADALRAAHEGADAIRHVLPSHFNWTLFWVALTLMAAPAIQLARRIRPSMPVPGRAARR